MPISDPRQILDEYGDPAPTDDGIEYRRVFIDETPVSLGSAVGGSLRAYWWLWLSLFLIFLLSNWQVVLNVVDPVPLEYRVNPFPVMKRELHPGEMLTTTTYRCNNTQAPITYVNHRRWIRVDDDGQTPPIQIDDVVLTAEPGCVRSFSRRNAIPLGIDSGVWIIEGDALVSGRFRTFYIHYETDPFEVVP